MPVSKPPPKPLTHAERGTLGALARWGNPENRRVVRLADLPPTERAIVVAYLNLQMATKAAKQ